jgi:hypothetical protein
MAWIKWVQGSMLKGSKVQGLKFKVLGKLLPSF